MHSTRISNVRDKGDVVNLLARRLCGFKKVGGMINWPHPIWQLLPGVWECRKPLKLELSCQQTEHHRLSGSFFMLVAWALCPRPGPFLAPTHATFIHCTTPTEKLLLLLGSHNNIGIYEAHSNQDLRSLNARASGDRSLLTCAHIRRFPGWELG